MALSGIISISGLSGLHKILSHTKNGLIVESLMDGKRRPIYSSQKVSSLEDISIYTQDEDVPLKDVFKLMFDKEKGKKCLDHKTDHKKLRTYLNDLVKKLDNDRVYNSDVAKLFHWYNILIEKDLMNFDEDKKEDEKSTEKSDKDSKKKTTKTKSTTAKKVTKTAEKKIVKSKSTPTKKVANAPAKTGRASKKA